MRSAQCRSIAANSSLTDRSRSRPLYHPEISASPNRSRIGRNTAGSRGNLWPSSIPSYPARRASARQVSSGVSPPNSGKSSLLQPIGLMPRRTGIGHGSPSSILKRAYPAERRIATAKRRLLQGVKTGGIGNDHDPPHDGTKALVRFLAAQRGETDGRD